MAAKLVNNELVRMWKETYDLALSYSFVIGLSIIREKK
jgi:hypothetical protein